MIGNYCQRTAVELMEGEVPIDTASAINERIKFTAEIAIKRKEPVFLHWNGLLSRNMCTNCADIADLSGIECWEGNHADGGQR
jgi:hypothetical protein